MNKDPRHAPPATPPCAAHDSDTPDAEALLAGTLALMTAYGDPMAAGAHKPLMGARIVANLDALSAHPLLSPAFRTMLWGLRERWGACAAARACPTCEVDTVPAHWHRAPTSVQ